MWTKNKPIDQNKSFIEIARRTQIVECAIEVIAQIGYVNTSLAKIAKHAGISKGVISYHFVDKDELIAEVALTVMNNFADYVIPLLEATNTVSDTLRVFMEANITFVRDHHNHMATWLEILLHASVGESITAMMESDVDKLEYILKQGQKKGEFRDFDTRIMAESILSLRNGIIRRIIHDPKHDLDHYVSELTSIVYLATIKNG